MHHAPRHPNMQCVVGNVHMEQISGKLKQKAKKLHTKAKNKNSTHRAEAEKNVYMFR